MIPVIDIIIKTGNFHVTLHHLWRSLKKKDINKNVFYLLSETNLVNWKEQTQTFRMSHSLMNWSFPWVISDRVSPFCEREKRRGITNSRGTSSFTSLVWPMQRWRSKSLGWLEKVRGYPKAMQWLRGSVRSAAIGVDADLPCSKSWLLCWWSRSAWERW